MTTTFSLLKYYFHGFAHMNTDICLHICTNNTNKCIHEHMEIRTQKKKKLKLHINYYTKACIHTNPKEY